MSKKTILSKKISSILFLSALCTSFSCLSIAYANPSSSLTEDDKKDIRSASPSESPLSVKGSVAPLVMLVMGREHNIFSEAYPDYTDIDGNGTIDIMYDPSIKYEGLFESNLCYVYEDSTTNIKPYNNTDKQKPNGIWVPSGNATETTRSLTMWNNETRTVYLCSGNDWSGNFLNYATTSRIDAIKRVLYGGTRLYNTTTPNNSSIPSKYIGNNNKATILKHTHVLRDAHAWGKVLGDDMYEGKMTVHDFTEMPKTGNGKAYFFVIASKDDSRGSSHYIRYGLVDDAGMPGITNPNAKNYIWDWASLQSAGQDDNYAIGSKKVKKKNNKEESLFVDEKVFSRDILVATCTNKYHPAEHCKAYGNLTNPNYQPYGVLQQYGQGSKPDMNFGLITGSWASNSQYAALRANLGILASEINVEGNEKLEPGDFDFSASCNDKSCHGLISTLDHFDINTKVKGESETYSDCARTASSLPNVGQSSFRCSDWGNPLGKLLYGALAYYRGDIQNYTQNEDNLGIGSATYVAPYNNPSSTIPYCALPHALMIADENVSFDSSEYPGGSAGYNGNVDAIEKEVAALSKEPNSGFKEGKYFVGKVKGASLDYYDYLPTLKYIETLADVVGVAPTAAYSFGSYNVAGVASLYSHSDKPFVTAKDKNNEKNTKDHTLKTYVVAMKPNMPEIKINIDGKRYVTLLPFAKTPELKYTEKKDEKIKKNSTNQVADFYVEKLTDTEGIFRINYEDFQYGSDYDMDAVIGYKYEVITGNSGAKYVRIQLSNVDGDGHAAQNAGYVIAGVEHEGAYIDLAKHKTSDDENHILDIDNIINDFSLTNGCDTEGSYYNALKQGDKGCSSYNRNITVNEKTYRDLLGITENGNQLIGSNIDNYYNNIINNEKTVWGNLYYKTRFEIVQFLKGKHTDAQEEAQKLMLVGYPKRKTDAQNQVTSRIFKVANETSDVWLKSPLWYAAKFGLDKERGTEGEPSNYFLASNPAMLRSGINEMLKKINTKTHSGSSFATEKKATSSGDYAYATLYDPSTWWGDVRNAKIDTERGTNEGGYDYDSFNNGWSLKDAMENLDQNQDNKKAPKKRAIVTFDAKEGHLVRFFAGENSAKNKERALKDNENSAYKNIGQNVADLIMGGTYDNENGGHKLYLNRLTRWLAGEHQYEYKGTASAPDTLELNLVENEDSPLRVRSTDVNNNDMSLRYTLGDIINSDVKVFTDKPQGQSGGNKLLVVGANDGMLHFAKIENEEKDGIKLLLSYVPTPALPRLKELARQNYGNSKHDYFVDSTPQVYKDESNVVLYGTYGLGLRGAYAFNVANLGSKLKTDGSELDTSNDIITPLTNMGFLRWELTDDVLYAGKMREAPVLAYSKGETTKEHPYLIFSSGYDADKSGIFVVDMLASNDSSCLQEQDGVYKGDIPKKSPCIVSAMPLSSVMSSDKGDLSNLDPWGMNRKNVPTRVTLLDLDSNHNYQAIYWADNFGLVWKAPLNHKDIIKNPKCWGGFANCLLTTESNGSTHTTTNNELYKPRIIFRAVDSNNVAQPITTRPAVGYHKNSGIGIVIGTGSYWVHADSTETSLRYNSSQSVYMIRDLSNSYDLNGKSVNASESDVRRCIGNSGSSKCLKELKVTVAEDKGKKFRKFEPNNNHAGNVNYGWYFDLNPLDENGNITTGSGERIYINPVISGDTLTIASNVPNVSDSCKGGGKSYVIQGSLQGGKFNQKAEFNALAKNLVVNVYTDADGNIKTIIQVPLDDEDSSLAGVKTVPLETSEPTVRSSSWLRLY